jgi:tetratricopeptide (TPR) repeat protein
MPERRLPSPLARGRHRAALLRETMRTRALAWLLALVAGFLGPAAARAGALGPWEELILDGMRRQDARLKQVSIDAVVREAYLAADRPGHGPDDKVTRLYLLGRAYGKRLNAAQRDLENARDAYREVLKLAPGCYFAHRDLGILALKGEPKDESQALAHLQKALSYHPSYVQALRDLAALFRSKQQHAEAVVHLRQVVDLEPADLLARAYLAAALIDLGKPEEARREVNYLLRSAPQNAAFRDLQAELDLATGRIEEAIAQWKVLMLENPSSPRPLQGLWKAYSAKMKAKQPVPPDDVKDVVKRLLLLEQDPAQKKRLQELYAQLDAPPPDPSQPPDDAALLRAFARPEEKARETAAKYVTYRKEKPTQQIVLALIGRLGSQREPVPQVRAAALGALAVHGGLGTLPVVRLLLADPDARVRLAAALALEDIGSQSAEASRAALLVLARHAGDPDATLAASARGATLRLAGGILEPLDDSETDTEVGRVARWRAWWGSPAAVDTKIRALQVYDVVRDHQADGVLAHYLDDPDVFVVKAAYEALARMGAYVPDPALRDWAGRIPRFLPGEFQAANRDNVVRSLKAWLGLRPPPR